MVCPFGSFADTRFERRASVSYAMFIDGVRLRLRLSALVLGRLGDRGDVRMVAEKFSQCTTEDAHASAVDDADARQPCEEGAIEEALDFGLGLVCGAADYVDL